MFKSAQDIKKKTSVLNIQLLIAIEFQKREKYHLDWIV